MAQFAQNYGVLITATASLLGVLITALVTIVVLRNNLKVQREQFENQRKLLDKQLEHQKKINDEQLEHQKKTTIEQLNYQHKITNEQLEHQKEMAYLQHFLDKRAEVILQFRMDLEDAISTLRYFHTNKADMERRTKLRVSYKPSSGTPKTREDIMTDKITENDMINMLDHALEQLFPVEEKLQSLHSNFNMLSIYLNEDEGEIDTINELITRIENLTHQLTNGIKALRQERNPQSYQLTSLVHIGEPYTPLLEDINERVKEVREILKPYLLIHRL